MYADPINPKRTIIRAFADTGAVKEEGTERVTLYRDDKHLYINGVRFPMRRLQRGEEQQLWLGNLSVTDRDYETELDAAATSIDRLVRDLSDNLFVSEEDKKERSSIRLHRPQGNSLGACGHAQTEIWRRIILQ